MCVGEASKLIESCVVMEPNVGHKRTRELLDDMFGNTYIVVEARIKRVTVSDRQVISRKDCDGLNEFPDELRNCGETFKAMWYISEISSQREMVKIVERLPMYLRSRWLREV